MGDKLMDRMITELARVPEIARGLAMILARLAHDQDDQPCCWASPATLTKMLYGEDTTATRGRYKRRVQMLLDAGLIRRAHRPHQGRPKSRRCPKDGRRFHVELFPIEDAERSLSDVPEDDETAEIGNAGRPLNAGDRERGATEIGNAGRSALKESPIETPSSSESPRTRGRSPGEAGGARATDSGGTDPSETESLSVVTSESRIQTSPSVGARASNEDGFGNGKNQDQKQRRLDEEPRCKTCSVYKSNHGRVDDHPFQPRPEEPRCELCGIPEHIHDRAMRSAALPEGARHEFEPQTRKTGVP